MARSGSILIIDDEQSARDTLEALLAPEGYRLELAGDGPSGMAMAAREPPDLVLLDVMMPGMDGFEVCRRLRETPGLAELPVVLLTALDDRESRLEGFEAGADDFVSKPFHREELRARIRTIVRLNRYRRLLEQEEQLAYLANYDTLTGLPNRHLLLEHLRQAVRRAGRAGSGVVLLSLYADGINRVNDAFGHGVGDRVLHEVAERLRHAIRAADVLARVGGGEFAVMQVSDRPDRDATVMVRRVLAPFGQALGVEQTELFLQPRVGIALFPDDAPDADALLANAQTARSQALDRPESYRFFSASMNTEAVRRLTLEAGLRRGLARGELVVRYQPKVDLGSGRIRGAEALVRWRTADGRTILPTEFIPLAEETGLIAGIDFRVLEEVCRALADGWRRDLPRVPVSVNLSGRQFRAPDLVERVGATLAASGVDPALLELELTETYLAVEAGARASEVAEKVKAIKGMGLRVAVDDFGTGYSALSQLCRLPVDILKIDRSFVAGLGGDDASAAVVLSIGALAGRLGLGVVAEGVETREQLRFLKGCGCGLVQGFLFSEAVPLEDFQALIEAGPFDTG